jgi:Raf kinase inhibitor-like YbhB/YbcL family protein
MKRQSARLWALLLGISLVVATGEPALSQQVFTLFSAAFTSGAAIPVIYTCSGEDKSPALSWTNVPHSTRSLALIVSDPDAPMGTFIHWVIYNIPANLSGLAEGLKKSGTVADVGTQGVNSAGQLGYKGPCPPPGKPHHYHFRLYALDYATQAKPGLSANQLERLMRGHVLASTEIVGIFSR